MKHTAIMTAALTMALTLNAVEVDGIVATVNNESILMSEVVGEMARLGRSDQRTAELVVNELINRKLILKASRDQKMTMQEWVVENRVREVIKRSFGGDRNRLMDQLARDRISYPEWYARIREDLIVSAMRYQMIEKNVVATPKALREEYAAHPERYSEKSGRVTVSIILLAPEEESEMATATFEEDADVYENVRPEEVFLPEVCEALETLETGGISDWLEVKGHWFRVRKDGEELARLKTFEEAFEDVEAAVKAAAAERLYGEWVKRLRSEAYIKIY